MDRRKKERDRERKRAARQAQIDHCVKAGTSQQQHGSTAAGIEHTLSTTVSCRKRSLTKAQSYHTIVDVHEESFHGLQDKDVLAGELSIQMMDFVSHILKAQFPSTSGLLAPSFLLGLEMAHRNSPDIKIDKDTTSVQIHFVNNHYLVSTQRNRQLYVYDSLYNLQHLQSLQYQLQLLYKDVAINSVTYLVPQSQGATNLCGFFAISTAETLLRNRSPGLRFLDCSLMRSHLYKCLQDASIQQFPSVQSCRKDTVTENTNQLNETAQDTTEINALSTSQAQGRCTQTCKFVQSVQLRLKDRERKQLKRLNTDVKMKERDGSRSSKQKRRSDLQTQEKERQVSRDSKLKRRTDSKTRDEDRRKNKEYMSKRRTDPQTRNEDREKNKECMLKRRADPKTRDIDREKNKECMSKRRADPKTRDKDREKNKECSSKRRTDPKTRDKDREKNKECMSKRRTAPKTRDKDREKIKECMSNLRTDPKQREKDRQRTRLSMHKRRLDHCVKDNEREKMKIYRRKKRQDPAIRHKERKSIRKRKHENRLRRQRRKQRLERSTIDAAAALFRNTVAKGCKFVCTCCHQVWFKNSVAPASSVECTDDNLRSNCFTEKQSFDNREWMCVTCAASIRKKKLPVLAHANGMFFSSKPDVLELNSLEERLVAPVNPFMQLRELPSGGQVSIKGNVVNVPSDNVHTVTTLPRRLDESGTIPVKLKRRLRYKTVKWLLQKPLFREHVVQGIDPQWLSSCRAEEHNIEWREFLEGSSSDHTAVSHMCNVPFTDCAQTTTPHFSEDTPNMQEALSSPHTFTFKI